MYIFKLTLELHVCCRTFCFWEKFSNDDQISNKIESLSFPTSHFAIHISQIQNPQSTFMYLSSPSMSSHVSPSLQPLSLVNPSSGIPFFEQFIGKPHKKNPNLRI
ncbi:hypothetical protein VNO78_11304 [Psophocarpus tetragonolobus]|uniref:Uncharacterized protein n=1 Tax=Psophocarpus tetragonolobus TaxID=3891 RepID=A0AAN9XNH6_PSOTE